MLRRRLMKSGGIPKDAVDLGLPSGLLWCTHNIGGTNPEDYGYYFSWGNVDGHEKGSGYDFKGNPEYFSTSGKSLTGNIPANETYDIARKVMGSPWRLPTKDEFKELYDNTDNEWVIYSNGEWETNPHGYAVGVQGRKFMKKSDHSVYIIIPACGYYDSTSLRNTQVLLYWSSSYKDDLFAYYVQSGYNHYYPSQSYYYRYNGLTGRAVCDVTKTADVIQDGDEGGDEGEDVVISTFLREYVLRITGVTKSSKTGYLNTRASYNGFTSYTYKCPSGNYRPSWSVSFEKRIDSYDKYSSGKEVLTGSLNVLDSTHYYECNLSVNRYTDGTVKISQGSINLADNQTSTWGENTIYLNLEGGNGSYTGSDTHLNTVIYNVNVSYDGSSSTADVKIYSDDSFEITLYP